MDSRPEVKADDTVLVLGASGGASAGPEGQVPVQSLYSKGVRILGYAGLLESDEAMSAAIGTRCRHWPRVS